MAFKGRDKKLIDYADLITILVSAKLQDKNFPLYQTIKGLIDRNQQNKGYINQILNSFFGDVEITDGTDLSTILAAISNINSILANATFWTELDETLRLASSRRVVAGTGITLDYTISGQAIINSTGGGSGTVYYAPLTDGNIDETEFIFAVGECIMVPVPL